MKQIFVGEDQRRNIREKRKKVLRILNISLLGVLGVLIIIPFAFSSRIFYSQSDMSPVALISTDRGSGSAIYVGDNRLLTAAHVVEGTSGECIVEFRNPNDDNVPRITVSAEVLYKGDFSNNNVNEDYALLHISNINAENYITSVKFAESKKAKVKDEIFIEGYPAGVYGTTTGIIGSLAVGDELKNLFVVDAKAWHGNSGGALFDKSNKLLGVVTMVGNRNGLNDDQTYVLKIDHIKKQLKSKGFSLD
jgi:S1-C subfamily serine protease